jgi:F0F1-type ATP synthase assembly protein I
MAPISTPDDLDLQPTRVGGAIRSSMRGLDQASIMGVELVAAILTWGAIGWFIDERLGTGPWGILVGALIGNAAGLYLVFLRGNRMEGYEDLPTRKAGGHADGR